MKVVTINPARKSGASAKSQAPTGEELRAQIRQRAFELYEQNGREDGHDVEHWLQAEQEIAAGQADESSK